MGRALVIGASGYVGRRMVEILGPDRAIGTGNTHVTGNLVQFDAVGSRLRDLLKTLPGDISHVFVCFGRVNPDQCALDPEGTAETNVAAVKRVIEDTQDAGLTPVFISTDYVFDGTRGLRREDEDQCPTTEYGRQKAVVEQWLQDRDKPWMIARLSKVVGSETNTHSVLGQWVNDIRAGKPMRSASDQIFSPAHVDDIVHALADLADRDALGIFHVAGAAISRYDLNRLLVDAIRSVDPTIEAVVQPCSLAEIPFRENRPLDTSLSTQHLENTLNWRFTPMSEFVHKVALEHFITATV